ncbi:13666_t:CDS:2 [Gigaspora margarita]|uniref:13666_t:CDS:1 n=1 Tax=Gigaspora margarita TaxID=4874 RepID=A0ABN7W8W4_GIGMA|nr:13666_t:CDS:2 [Gigaspora margarita]
MDETIANIQANEDIFQDEPHQADNKIADDSDHNQFDNSTWIPTGKMLNLLTRIHKKNLLSQSFKNAEIKYKAPTIDKQIWKLMLTHAKNTDKLLAKIAYRSSAVLQPLDNSLRAIYNSKPENNTEALQI